MIHIDVKKLGQIHVGGGGRLGPAQSARIHNTGNIRVGFDYVHVAVNDHSRLSFVEAHPERRVPAAPDSSPGQPPSRHPTGRRRKG